MHLAQLHISRGMQRPQSKRHSKGFPDTKNQIVLGTLSFTADHLSTVSHLCPCVLHRSFKSSSRDCPARRRPDYVPNRIFDPNYVRIFDTTLRDGEQSPGAHLTSKEKLDIARQLAKLGVDVIEAGFPVTSPDDFAAVKAIAMEVGNEVQEDGYVPVICGMVSLKLQLLQHCCIMYCIGGLWGQCAVSGWGARSLHFVAVARGQTFCGSSKGTDILWQ